MSDKASESANEFDTYWLLSPQREEQKPTFRRFYLAGYEKGREAGRDEMAMEINNMIPDLGAHPTIAPLLEALKKVITCKALARDGEKS